MTTAAPSSNASGRADSSGFDATLLAASATPETPRDTYYARGGMGEVLKVADNDIQRPVAIKRLLPGIGLLSVLGGLTFGALRLLGVA